MSEDGPAELARLHADALLLLRGTGLRIGELRDLELDCVHQIPAQRAWVPLGKLGTERMVPLDETLAILDRIAARRTPGRPLRHPRTGRPADFLLVYQGRRVSARALRDALARACHGQPCQGAPCGLVKPPVRTISHGQELADGYTSGDAARVKYHSRMPAGRADRRGRRLQVG